MDAEPEVIRLLHSIFLRPCTVQSDRARKDAWPLALAASHGLISVGDDRRWRPTSLGLLFIHL